MKIMVEESEGKLVDRITVTRGYDSHSKPRAGIVTDK